MLVSTLYFWEGTTNTFQFGAGMMTPTLFDVAAITGLRPTGETFSPTEADENVIPFDKNSAGFGKYMERFHVKNVDTVSDEEHIAFLALWLSKHVFCSRSLKVAKRFIALANHLHQGRNVRLSELILGSL